MVRKIVVLLLASHIEIGFGQVAKPTRYYIDTIAGAGGPISSKGLDAKGEQATTIPLYKPKAIALDQNQNLYVVEYNRVRRIAPDGALSGVVGTGDSAGNPSGIGGLANQAILRDLKQVAFDAQGSLILSYVGSGPRDQTGGGFFVPRFYRVGSDALILESSPNWPTGRFDSEFGRFAIGPRGELLIPLDHRIIAASAEGAVETIAGTGEFGFAGDGGPAKASRLGFISSVATDPRGNIYFIDGSYEASMRFPPPARNHALRVINSAGIVTTLAGSNISGFSGDGGPASSARFSDPSDLAVDASGSIYVADTGNHRIRKISPLGIITTIAGNGSRGYSGDGGPALNAELNTPQGVAVDRSGRLYIADTLNNVIRIVDAAGTIHTIAGNEGRATALRAGLSSPLGLAIDANRNLLVADDGRIKRIAPNGNVSTIAGVHGELDSCCQGGIAVDPAGVIYAAAWSRVYKILPSGAVTTLPIPSLKLANAVSLDSLGNLFIADSLSHQVMKVTPSGSVTIVAGNGRAGYSGDGGPATDASLNSPNGLYLDASGRMFIADLQNNRIRVVDSRGIITTFAGNGINGFAGDGGPAREATVYQPNSVAGDVFGNIFILSFNKIRLVSPDGAIRTIAGNNDAIPQREGAPSILSASERGDGGPAIPGIFRASFAAGMTVDVTGHVLFSDYSNGRVRILRPAESVGPGLVNSFSYVPKYISPGEAVSILAQDIGPQNPASIVLDSSNRVSTSLAGVRVLFDGVPAPLLYVSRNQVNAVTPYMVSDRQTSDVEVLFNGRTTFSQRLEVREANPALASLDGLGGGQAAAVNQDGTINSRGNPAVKGSIISLFLTGTGQTSPRSIDGTLAAAPLPAPSSRILIRLSTGGQIFYPRVVFAGSAPGSIGLTQVNMMVPDEIAPGDSVALLIQVGNVWTPTGITLSIR